MHKFFRWFLWCATLCLLVGCEDLTRPQRAQFDRDAKSAEVTINFSEFSGDMTPEEFGTLLRKEGIVVSLVTSPVKLIDGENAHSEYVYSGSLPIPQGTRLVPIEETVLLDRNHYSIKNDRTVVVQVPSSTGRNRQTVRLVVAIPSPQRSFRWRRYIKVDPPKKSWMTLEVDFASESMDRPSPQDISDNGKSRNLTFAREDPVFGVAGTITLVGAMASLNDVDDLLDSDDRIFIDGKSTFTPSSPFANYRAALAAHDPANANDSPRKIHALQDTTGTDNCCSPNESELRDRREVCRAAIAAHMDEFNRQHGDVAPFDSPYTTASTNGDGVPRAYGKLVEAKAQGHHLQYVNIEIHADANLMTHPLAGEYEIFYVDRLPYLYLVRQSSDSNAEHSDRVETRVRWDAERRVSVFKVGPPRYYQTDPDKAQAIVPEPAAVKSVEDNARRILESFVAAPRCE